MDSMALLRELGAERAEEDPRARAAAWRALEARFDLAEQPGAATGPDRARTARPRRPRRGLLAGPTTARPGAAGASRRRLLALSGGAIVAAAVAAVVVLGSGSNPAPAGAEVLRKAAAVAAASGKPVELPGPGQFLFGKSESVVLNGWIPGGSTSIGGQLKFHGAFNALIATTTESWIGPHGEGRERQVMTAPPRFLSNAERLRWRKAGSPLPGILDPRVQREDMDIYTRGGGKVLEARRGVFDSTHPRPPGRGLGPELGFPDYSRLPTRPEALRHAIQRNGIPGLGNAPHGVRKALDIEETISGLLGLLGSPNTSSALRAAAFNALAELPGIEVRTGVADLAGREGDAIRYVEKRYGWANEVIFDPDTAEVLGQRETVLVPGVSPSTDGLPVGLRTHDGAALRSAVVGSEHARGDASARASGS